MTSVPIVVEGSFDRASKEYSVLEVDEGTLAVLLEGNSYFKALGDDSDTYLITPTRTYYTQLLNSSNTQLVGAKTFADSVLPIRFSFEERLVLKPCTPCFKQVYERLASQRLDFNFMPKDTQPTTMEALADLVCASTMELRQFLCAIGAVPLELGSGTHYHLVEEKCLADIRFAFLECLDGPNPETLEEEFCKSFGCERGSPLNKAALITAIDYYCELTDGERNAILDGIVPTELRLCSSAYIFDEVYEMSTGVEPRKILEELTDELSLHCIPAPMIMDAQRQFNLKPEGTPLKQLADVLEVLCSPCNIFRRRRLLLARTSEPKCSVISPSASCLPPNSPLRFMNAISVQRLDICSLPWGQADRAYALFKTYPFLPSPYVLEVLHDVPIPGHTVAEALASETRLCPPLPCGTSVVTWRRERCFLVSEITKTI